MVKRIVNLYMEVDVIERHKIAGTNISAACNEFLKTYFLDEETNEQRDTEKEVQALRSRLAQANTKLESQKQKEKADSSKKEKERLVTVIIKLRKLNIEKQAGSVLADESYKALFEGTMEEFGLSRQVLADKVF